MSTHFILLCDLHLCKLDVPVSLFNFRYSLFNRLRFRWLRDREVRHRPFALVWLCRGFLLLFCNLGLRALLLQPLPHIGYLYNRRRCLWQYIKLIVTWWNNPSCFWCLPFNILLLISFPFNCRRPCLLLAVLFILLRENLCSYRGNPVALGIEFIVIGSNPHIFRFSGQRRQLLLHNWFWFELVWSSAMHHLLKFRIKYYNILILNMHY